MEASLAAGLTRAEWMGLHKALAKLSARCEAMGAADMQVED